MRVNAKTQMYVVVCNETEIDAAVIVQVPLSLLFNMAEVFIQAKHLFLAGIYPVLPVRRSATLRLIYTTIFSWVFTCRKCAQNGFLLIIQKALIDSITVLIFH